MGSLFRILRPFVTLGLSLLVPYITRRLRTTDDLRRAQLLAFLADGVVAELLAQNPGASWIELVEDAIDILRGAIPSNPTKSEDAMRRAVSAALAKKGVLPAS